MGERAPGLGPPSTDERLNGTHAASPREATRRLEGDIAALREDLGTLVSELDRRRHELVDVKLQLRRHAGAAVLTGVALVAAATGIVWLKVWQARQRQRPLSQVGRLGEAVSRMMARPERVAAEPTVAGKILTAATTAAVAALVKRGLEWMIHAALSSSDADASRPRMIREPEHWPASTHDGARSG